MWRALYIMNFPPRNWEGYYASSSKMGGKLCLLIGVRTLPFTPHDGHRFGS